ncbi:Complex I-B12 [Aphelenchoides bicaudatus]|nr:Complex I-B12 [Aphelenchoides bicaudatus]
MGGGHHHEPFEVPHPSVYNNYRKCPQLAAHEDRLARLGLKDPWIRNYVFVFDNKVPKHGPFARMWYVLKPGFRIGLGMAVGLIAIEESYSYFKHGHTSWNAHH